MKHRIMRLLAICLVFLLVPGLSLGETYNNSVTLPAFSLKEYPATTTVSRVTVWFSGADGYTYVLEHRYKGVWLASAAVQLTGNSGGIEVDCLPGVNKFVLRNYGQSRKAKSAIAFTIQCTATDTPDKVKLPTPTLRKGSKGAAVKALHQVLSELGVYFGPMSSTFTQDTKDAVIAAQRMFSITQDGIAGPQTLHLLDLEEYSVSAASIGATTTDGTQTGTRNLKKGMTGEDVRKLQKRLLALGYSAGPADGIFGDITLSAVLLYQQNASISQDGVVGPVTWKKLNNGTASLVVNPPLSSSLRKGSRGEKVAAVQARLIVLGYLDDDADGIFGKLTFAAVKAFQQDQGILVDGIVGPVTYGKLFP